MYYIIHLCEKYYLKVSYEHFYKWCVSSELSYMTFQWFMNHPFPETALWIPLWGYTVMLYLLLQLTIIISTKTGSLFLSSSTGDKTGRTFSCRTYIPGFIHIRCVWCMVYIDAICIARLGNSDNLTFLNTT